MTMGHVMVRQIDDVVRAYRRALRYVGTYPHLQVVLCVFMLLELPVSASLPLISKYMVDHAILGHNLDLFLRFAFLSVGYYLASVLIDLSYSMVSNNFKMRYARDFQFRLLRDALTRPYDPERTTHAGELVTKVMEDAGTVTQAVAMFVPNAIIKIIRTLVLLYLSCSFDPRMTLLALAAVPAYYPLRSRFGAWQAHAFRQVRDSVQDLYGTMARIAQQIISIKANRYEPYALRRFRHNYHQYLDRQIQSGIARYAGTHSQGLLVGGFVFVASCYFIVRVIRGECSLGFFIAYSMYLRMLVGDLASYGSMWQGMLSAYPAFERAFSLMSSGAPVRTGPAGAGVELELRDVSCHVGDKSLFRDVNQVIHEGQCAVIEGGNGAGKTLLLHLLSGMILPSEGRILLGGRDLATASRSWLRDTVRVVTCGPHFDHEYFAFAPRPSSQGPTAPPDPSFDKRSTGEQYMRVFAWGVSRNPRLLLLDEPFANLDPRCHQAVVDTLQTLRGRVTVVLTCHDSQGVRVPADVLLELKDGALLRKEPAPC
jgi:ABC-type bacteriocin/lantibiotic exporter with double-glycine peptidase domain